MKEIWYAYSELLKRCGMIGHWTQETDSLNRYSQKKNLSLDLLLYISCNYKILLWKYEWTNNVVEYEMQKLGANQKLKSGIFVFWNPESALEYCPELPYMGRSVICH